MNQRLHLILKASLYIAAMILLPGALIGAPILWWINHRKRAGPTNEPIESTNARGQTATGSTEDLLAPECAQRKRDRARRLAFGFRRLSRC